MASVVKIKRSAVGGKAPTTSDITAGELALNTADGRLYSSKGVSTFEVGANTHSLYVGTGGATFGNGAFSLPTTDGSADQVIKTNGSGVLTWTDQSGGSSSVQTFPFYDSSSSLDTITVTGSSFTFYDSTGSQDDISLGNSININSLNDVTITSASSGQVLKYDGSGWVNGTDTGGASWAALTSTNTAIRTLVGQNLANTNAYIATKLDSSSYTTADVQSKAALANTNAYIATKVGSASPSFTGDASFDTNTLKVDGTNDRVGVRVTSPTHTLDVRSALSDVFRMQSSGANSQIIFYDSALVNTRVGSRSGALTLDTANVERARIDTSGNFGIGTSPSAKLDVYNSATAAQNNEILRLRYNTSTTAGHSGDVNFTNSSGTAVGRVSSVIQDGNNVALGFSTYSTTLGERMRIDGAGRVTKPNQPSFSGNLGASNLTTGTTNTLMTFSANIHAVGSDFDGSTGNHKFTCPVAGRYLFTFTTLMSTGSGIGNYAQVKLYKNGSIYFTGLGDNGTYINGLQILGFRPKRSNSIIVLEASISHSNSHVVSFGFMVNNVPVASLSANTNTSGSNATVYDGGNNPNSISVTNWKISPTNPGAGASMDIRVAGTASWSNNQTAYPLYINNRQNGDTRSISSITVYEIAQ